MAEWQNLEAGNATYVDDDGQAIIGCGDGEASPEQDTPLFDSPGEVSPAGNGEGGQPSTPTPDALLGSTMRTLEANGWAPMDAHERLGDQLHGVIQGLIDQPDGHGEAYDLSSVLGPGALGYLSPSGMLTLEPPVAAEDGWMVRGARPDSGEDTVVGEAGDTDLEQPGDQQQQELGLEQEDQPEEESTDPTGDSGAEAPNTQGIPHVSDDEFVNGGWAQTHAG